MDSRKRLLPVMGLLLAVLLASVALNLRLFGQGRQYYLQLNDQRLDPLGLSYYPADPDQRGVLSPDLTTVVLFGDSRAADWPAPDLDGFEFINRGIGAQTSAQVAHRFEHHVAPLNPQVVVVQVGINDLKTIPLFPERAEDIVAKCTEEIRRVVAMSTASGATVVLTTIFPLGSVPVERRPFWSDRVAVAIDEVNTDIRSLGGEGVLVLDAYAVLAGEDGTIMPEYSRDLLHLSVTGYERLNDELASVLLGIVDG